MMILEKLSNLSLSSLQATPDGAYTLKEDNRYVHSTRAPLKEAQKLIANIPQKSKNTLIIAWGTGLGYHIELLLEQGYDVLAIELRQESASIFKQIFPINKLVAFITDSDSTKLFDKMLNLDAQQYNYFIDIVMLGVDISQSLLKQANQAKRALTSQHNIHSALMDMWYYNIIQNISSFVKKNIGYTHDPIFQNQTLVICSAGPSLKESLPYIKKNRKQITVLAVDTALLSLIQDDIIPDFVHSVDAKIHNIADFRGIDSTVFQQITLISDITLSHQIIALPWKEILFVATAHPITNDSQTIYKRTVLQQYLWDKNIRFPEVQTGGSVATSAFHLGIIYKADKILLVGQDLAYSQNRGYAVGSPYDMEYRLQTGRLKPLDTIHIHKVPFNGYKIPAIDHSYTYADTLLNQFRSWFEVSLENNPVLSSKVVNASENGAFFKNWTHLSLAHYSFKKQESQGYIIQRYTKGQLISILEELSNLSMTLENQDPICREFFYKELSSNNVLPKQLEKKKKLFDKKITRALCQIQS